MKLPRRTLATLTTTGLAAAAVVAGVGSAPAAHAAPRAIDDATLTWAINDEVNAGAFAPGTWNLMSAGTIGNPGAGGTTLKTADSGATWSNNAAAGWDSTVGNVTVEDKQPDGSWAPATFQGTRTNTLGQPTSGASSSILAETRLSLANGTGTLDPAAGTASITWDGDATVLFYSGMTYFTLSDPTLTVQAGGAATLTATAGGYATSMEDPTAWTALPATQVTLASMTGVQVTGDGFTAPAAYSSVTYDAAAGESPQVRTSTGWGAFPTDFVRFQQQVGQGPYWYSTGGSADVRKTARPVSVVFDAPDPAPAQGVVVASQTTFEPTGTHQVTVTGTGFDPAASTATRPPLAGKPSGAYVAFGKFAQTWRPSASAPSTSRKSTSVKWAVRAEDMATIGGAAAGAVELRADGSFTTTLTVDKAAIDAAATDPSLIGYGIYTYAGGGASTAAYETFTPVTFATAPVTAPVTPPTTAPVTPVTPVVPVVPAKLVTTTKASIAKRPTASRGGRATITVPGVATGTVRTVLRSAKGKKVGSVRKSAAVKGGVAKVSLPRLRRGVWTLTVRYAGSSTSLPSRTTTTIRVR